MNNETNNTVNQQPTITSSTPAAPAVPTAVSEAPTVTTTPAQPAAPTQPIQQRVQLVNDTPALKAVAPSTTENSQPTSEATEVLETADTKTAEPAAQEKKSGGCFQTFFLIVLFGGLFLFIFFIDDISSYIETQKYLKEQVVEEITTGTLKCTYENSTDNMDYTYEVKFGFRDSKLKRLDYVKEVRGDANLDEAALTALSTECLLVKEYASSLSGIDITCSLENGLLREKQVFNYDAVDREAAMSAFVEAGGIYPEYKRDQDIDGIEKNMNASGYNCERLK